MSALDFDFASLYLATVGLYFICLAIIGKKPRDILEEAFGLYSGGLRDLKASVFRRNRVALGFLCVVVALVIAIVARGGAAPTGLLDGMGTILLVTLLVGAMAALVAVLHRLSRVFSRWQFRRLVIDVVTEYHWPFEKNMALTREIGALIGVAEHENDSVEIYCARIRNHLKIPAISIADGPRRRLSQLG